MLILTIISLLMILSYIIIICIKNNGIPIHISQSYYILQHKFWFSFTMIALTFMLIPPLLSITPSNLQFLSFFTGASIGFIGVTPNFLEEFEGKIHEIAACIAILCSQLLIILLNPIILSTWIIYIVGIFIYMFVRKNNNFYKTNPLFWIEVISFFNIYILIFLGLFL